MNMSRFITTKEGAYLNLDYVRTLRRRHLRTDGDRPVYLATTDNDITHECSRSYDNQYDLDTLLWPVIPANEGFWLLTVYFSDEITVVPADIENDIGQQPIIGWRITDYETKPVTLQEYDNAAFIAILYPNGYIIELSGDCSYTNEQPSVNRAECMAEVRSLWQARIDQRAKRAAEDVAANRQAS